MLPPFDPWLSAAAAADVGASTYIEPRRLAALRERRLRTLVQSAARHSPLYRSLLRGVDPARLRLDELPVVS